jgi:two-component system OmpR family response regulator
LHLARNAGRVIDRAELMEHVWDDTQSTYSNIIDVYASRLRRKIDEGEKVALFKTIRGTGFMLDTPPPSRRAAPAAPLTRAKSPRERG